MFPEALSTSAWGSQGLQGQSPPCSNQNPANKTHKNLGALPPHPASAAIVFCFHSQQQAGLVALVVIPSPGNSSPRTCAGWKVPSSPAAAAGDRSCWRGIAGAAQGSAAETSLLLTHNSLCKTKRFQSNQGLVYMQIKCSPHKSKRQPQRLAKIIMFKFINIPILSFLTAGK